MIRAALPVLAALGLGNCAPAATDLSAEAAHPSIASLNPCLDAILVEVARPGQVAALSHYSRDPSASSIPSAVARRYRTTGGTVEELIALEPDIVLASTFTDPATRSAMERLDMRVATFGIAGSVADSLVQVEEIGRIAGRQEAARRLAERIEAAVAKARADEGTGPSIALWQPGGIVPGEAALVTQFVRIAGFTSSSVTRGMEQADYLDLESIIADPPDILLVAGNETGQQHPVLDRIGGMERVPFDTSLIYCGGPTIIAALERLTAIREEWRAGQ